MKTTFLVLGFLLVALAGCNDKAKPAETTDAKPTVITETKPVIISEEDLLGLSMDYEKKEISVVLVSKGCTQINDISLLVSNDELTVKRNRKDECKAMPEAMRFTFSFKDAGIDPDKNYTVKNRFIANPNLANIAR